MMDSPSKELVLIKPKSSAAGSSGRMDKLLLGLLNSNERNLKIFTRVDELREASCLKNRRILFAVDLDDWGINEEYIGFLRRIRAEKDLMAGSVGAVIVDGITQLYTKSVARELVFAANGAGCAFPGKSLVEATGDLQNYHIIAQNKNLDLYGAYCRSAEELLDRLMGYGEKKKKQPALLAVRAGSKQVSNTYGLWSMVKEGLGGCSIEEISLREGLQDCVGCPYTTCMRYGAAKSCCFNDIVVEKGYPALLECDGLVMVCPNYNDALSASLTAFINRLTALFRRYDLSGKKLFAVVVSGYSGGDIVACQLVGALNMNKPFDLPPRFALMETANLRGSIYNVENIEEKAAAFATHMKQCLME